MENSAKPDERGVRRGQRMIHLPTQQVYNYVDGVYEERVFARRFNHSHQDELKLSDCKIFGHDQALP